MNYGNGMLRPSYFLILNSVCLRSFSGDLLLRAKHAGLLDSRSPTGDTTCVRYIELFHGLTLRPFKTSRKRGWRQGLSHPMPVVSICSFC